MAVNIDFKEPATGRSLIFFTICHFLVDTLCYFYMFGTVLPALRLFERYNLIIPSLILYNLFAFALQFGWGILADRFIKFPVGLFGVVLLGFGFLPFVLPLLMTRIGILFAILIVMGIGNAAFHVEGGRDSFVRSRGNELRTGVFAAGGAAGVIVGTAVAKFRIVGLILLALWVLAIPTLAWLKFEAKRSQFWQTGPKYKMFTNISSQKWTRKCVIAASVFIVLQTMSLPTMSSMKRQVSLIGSSTYLSILVLSLGLVLVLSRPFGGWLTSQLSGLPFLFAGGVVSIISLLLPWNMPWLLILQGFILAAPSAWAGYQYYLLLPHRPAFAYSLQKIPMFLAAFIVLSKQEILGSNQSNEWLFELIVLFMWLASLFLFTIIYYRDVDRRRVFH
ncbi:MAG: MFS transporter, partial [Clostridiaceae bacterium]|nr:MFS transporter [Clostridiaceae bacterium]